MSSALDTARADIESAVSLAWESATPIQNTGRSLTPPASGSWVRVTPLFGDAFPMTMGPSGANRITGVVDVAIFAKKSDGLGEAVQYADDVRIALNQQRHGSVRFGVCSGPVEITSDAPGYAHLAVTAPFEVIE